MPFLKVNGKSLIVNRFKSSIHYSPFTIHLKQGFTLIEILLTLLIILAMVSILFSASGTFVSSRNVNLQGIATKIASREIENLRNMQYSSLPPTDSISDPDLSKLPAATATRTVADYDGSSKIKQVTININWIENGASKQIKLET